MIRKDPRPGIPGRKIVYNGITDIGFEQYIVIGKQVRVDDVMCEVMK